MVFEPTLNGMAADAVPDATVVPLTVMVSEVLAAVGVTVMDVCAYISATV